MHPAPERRLPPATALLARLYNVHRVDAHLLRAAQAYAGGFATLLRGLGVRTVVNLRGENPNSGWYRYEAAAAARAGAAYRDAALNSRRLPARDQLVALLDLVASAPGPVLVKCSGGADRTSFVAGLYLLDRQGAAALDAARASTAFWPYLHWPRRHQKWIRAFFDYYEESAQGRPLRAWLAESYSPENLATFMAARGQAGGHRPLGS